MSSKTRPTHTSADEGAKGGASVSAANDDACDLIIDVDLEGIRVSRLAGLTVGDLLDVELRLEGSFPTVVCVDSGGEVVGALSAFLNLVQLIRCLRDGVKYRVSVSQLRPGGCRVAGGRLPQ